MNTQASLLTVTRELVAEDQRLDIVERLFGMAFPLQLDPVVYGITDRMAEEYTGGYWHFYTLSNGGFYMAPAEYRTFHVKCQNMRVTCRRTRWGSRRVSTPTAICRSH